MGSGVPGTGTGTHGTGTGTPGTGTGTPGTGTNKTNYSVGELVSSMLAKNPTLANYKVLSQKIVGSNLVVTMEIENGEVYVVTYPIASLVNNNNNTDKTWKDSGDNTHLTLKNEDGATATSKNWKYNPETGKLEWHDYVPPAESADSGESSRAASKVSSKTNYDNDYQDNTPKNTTVYYGPDARKAQEAKQGAPVSVKRVKSCHDDSRFNYTVTYADGTTVKYSLYE
jgi:hypothetical protein